MKLFQALIELELFQVKGHHSPSPRVMFFKDHGPVYGNVRSITLSFFHVDKVTDVLTSVENQKVTVTSTMTSDELLAELKKTGKEVKFIGAV